MLQEVMHKYLAGSDSEQLQNSNIPVPDDLPADYASWPEEWQAAFDERVAIMAAHWRDYSIDKIIQQADQWTRYYYRKRQKHDS